MLAAVGADIAVAREQLAVGQARAQREGVDARHARVPMMLLTAICDCSPVSALCPPRKTAMRARFPAHLAGGVVDDGLLQRDPGLGQPWADSFKTFK
jgi:hypothetical protein